MADHGFDEDYILRQLEAAEAEGEEGSEGEEDPDIAALLGGAGDDDELLGSGGDSPSAEEISAMAKESGVDLAQLEGVIRQTEARFSDAISPPVPASSDSVRPQAPRPAASASAGQRAAGQHAAQSSAGSAPSPPSLRAQLSETRSLVEAALKAGDFARVAELSAAAERLQEAVSRAEGAPASVAGAGRLTRDDVARGLRARVARDQAEALASAGAAKAAANMEARLEAELRGSWARRDEAMCLAELACLEAGALTPAEAVAVRLVREGRDAQELAGFSSALKQFLHLVVTCIEQASAAGRAGKAGAPLRAWWLKVKEGAAASLAHVRRAAAMPFQPPPLVEVESKALVEITAPTRFADVPPDRLEVTVGELRPGAFAPGRPQRFRAVAHPAGLESDAAADAAVASEWAAASKGAEGVDLAATLLVPGVPSKRPTKPAAVARLVRKVETAALRIEIVGEDKGWFAATPVTRADAWIPLAGLSQVGEWAGCVPLAAPGSARPGRSRLIAASEALATSSAGGAGAAAPDAASAAHLRVRVRATAALGDASPRSRKVTFRIPRLLGFPPAAPPVALATAQSAMAGEAAADEAPAPAPASGGPPGRAAPATTPAAAAGAAPAASRRGPGIAVPPAELADPASPALLIAFEHLMPAYEELKAKVAAAGPVERVLLSAVLNQVGGTLDELETARDAGSLTPAIYARLLEMRRLKDSALAQELARAGRGAESAAVASRAKELLGMCVGMVEGGAMSKEEWVGVQKAALAAVMKPAAGPGKA